jgi:hypothetical protein
MEKWLKITDYFHRVYHITEGKNRVTIIYQLTYKSEKAQR